MISNDKISKIDEYSSKLRGRLGGNIPIEFEHREVEIKGYQFYLCVENPLTQNKMISIFLPKDYDLMIDHNIYPDCSIKLFVHDYTDESENENYTNKNINKSSLTPFSIVNGDDLGLIRIGDSPRLLQDENYYFEKIEEDGYNFLMQIDEDYYSDNTLNGDYPLGYGAIYIYSKKENIIVGFFQFG
jgi:hypothetical protein